MGLDVYLYQFKNLDTDKILKLLRFSEEPWAFEAFHKWSALPPSEKGPFPSEKDKAESHEKLVAKARELGLPEKLIDADHFGGTQISFPSKRHPQWIVGDWYSFSTTRALMENFTGKDIYFVFPEAKDGPRWFRPDWAAAKMRLVEILEELEKLDSAQLENFSCGLSESFGHHSSQIEVMIETLNFVLDSNRPSEFVLLWSD